MYTNSKTEIGFFAAVLAVIALVMFFVFKPYLSALFLAVIFAIMFRPLYEKILAGVKGRNGIAAAITVLLLILLIVIPVSFFGFFIFKDVQSFYYHVASGDSAGLFSRGVEFAESIAEKFVPGGEVNVIDYIKQVLGLILQNLGSIFGRVFTAVLQLFLMLLGVFYFLRDGKKFREYFIFLSPLSDSYDKTILGRMENAVNSVVKGALSIAFIQGILSGVGFAVFGVPSPMLWGAVAAIAALIPGVGTALVIFPAIVYLFFFASPMTALGLLVWGIIAVGLIDNILAPLLIERGLKIHPFLILLSVLGGLALFGPVGFLAGPVTLALLFALLELYPMIVSKRDAS